MGKVIYRARELGCRFDAWTEHLKYEDWLRAFADAGLEPGFYAHRKRSLDEVLPWSHINVGVTDTFLKQEYQRAREGLETSDCRHNACNACGLQEQQPECHQRYQY